MEKHPWLEQFIPTRLDWIIVITNSMFSTLFVNSSLSCMSIKSDNDDGIDFHILYKSDLDEDYKQQLCKTITDLADAIIEDYGWDSYDKLKTNFIFSSIKSDKNSDDNSEPIHKNNHH